MVHLHHFGLWLGMISLALSYRTIVELIGSDPLYSEMIYLLQESRMIPLINRLKASTLLILGNKELANLDQLYPTHLEKEKLVRYLLIKDNLTTSDIYSRTGQSPLVETWLGLNGSLGTVDPLGPNRGQMVKAQVQPGMGSALYLGGVRVTKGDLKADNGIVHVIEDYLHPPLGPIATLAKQPGLSYYLELLSLTPSLMKELKTPLPHSLFLWEDGAANAEFSPVERSYLSHPAHPVAADDREALVAASFVLSTIEQPFVIYKQSLLPGHSMYSFNMAGKPVVISRSKKDSEVVTYNTIPVKVTDILTSDGAIHVLESIPHHGLTFDALKYVVGLNASQFAISLNASALAPYLVSGRANCTVLVPHDFHMQPSAEIADMLHYHVLPGQHTAETLARRTLVPSFLAGELLRNNPQQIRVTMGAAGDVLLNGHSSVVGDPERIGGVNLLRVTHTLLAPLDILDNIAHDQELSMFYRLLRASGLAKSLAEEHGITALLPVNDAFQPHTQALLYDFLMNPENIDVLQDFVRFCVLEALSYSVEAKSKAPKTYPTLLESQPLTLRGGSMDGGESKWDVEPRLISFDRFVSTGVIHKTSGLLAPLSQAGRLKGMEFLRGHADIFLGLVERANLTHLFDESGAVVAPIDAAWKHINLTRLERDPLLLERTVRLHFLDQRLPRHLNLLTQALHAKTLASELPELRLLFSEQARDAHLRVRIINGPAALSTWNATILMSGQAHDVALALVDCILFVEKLPSNGPSFLTVLLTTLLSLGGLGYAGYSLYFRFFPVQARGYSPIPEPE